MTTLFWLGALIVFLIVEASTASLVSIWFSVGALSSAIAAYFGASDTLQIVLFAVISAICLTVFKKFFNSKITPVHEPTNADRLIGATGVVIEDIDPIKGTGTVKACSQIWSARAEYPIKKDSVVEVCEIKGVKLVVKEKVEVE